MNRYVWILLGIILVSMKTDTDKTKMICAKWVQFAFKQYDQNTPAPTAKASALTYILKEDKTYEELQYNGMLKIAGKWKFAEDQKKLLFIVTNVNGQTQTEFEGKPTTIILKLTPDTLIIGEEEYLTKAGSKEQLFIHNDQYFVKAK